MRKRIELEFESVGRARMGANEHLWILKLQESTWV